LLIDGLDPAHESDRLGLAQALIGQRSLIVLDEPAAGVDPDERFRIRDLVASRRTEATVLMSTHLPDEAAVCDTIVVLDNGSVCYVGSSLLASSRRSLPRNRRPTGSSWCRARGPPARGRLSHEPRITNFEIMNTLTSDDGEELVLFVDMYSMQVGRAMSRVLVTNPDALWASTDQLLDEVFGRMTRADDADDS